MTLKVNSGLFWERVPIIDLRVHTQILGTEVLIHVLDTGCQVKDLPLLRTTDSVFLLSCLESISYFAHHVTEHLSKQLRGHLSGLTVSEGTVHHGRKGVTAGKFCH